MPVHACVLSHFSRVLLCDLMACSPSGSSVHGLSRKEYWSEWPCPPPGDLPNPGIKRMSLMSPALAGSSLPLAPPGKLPLSIYCVNYRSGTEYKYSLIPSSRNLRPNR